MGHRGPDRFHFLATLPGTPQRKYFSARFKTKAALKLAKKHRTSNEAAPEYDMVNPDE